MVVRLVPGFVGWGGGPKNSCRFALTYGHKLQIHAHHSAPRSTWHPWHIPLLGNALGVGPKHACTISSGPHWLLALHQGTLLVNGKGVGGMRPGRVRSCFTRNARPLMLWNGIIGAKTELCGMGDALERRRASAALAATAGVTAGSRGLPLTSTAVQGLGI
jgi:hypothetical protein